MRSIKTTFDSFEQGSIDKPSFIKSMYEDHHAALFDYADHLASTNVKKIEIEDGRVVMTTRDRGVRIACLPGDFRIAPIEMLNFLDYEKDDSMMIDNLVGDADTFFDIGANIGWYSINIAVSRRAAKIYCFEPIPKTFENLQRNLALNAVPNVLAHNVGFSDRAGEFTFYTYPEGSGNASSENLTGRDDVKTVQCEVRTLDDYVTETGVRVDFIKCDVEGAELLVFKGGVETIARHKPIVFAEILRKWSAKFNYDPNEIFSLFHQLGYQAYTVQAQCLASCDHIDETTRETNFFFLHSEKHAERIRRYAMTV